LIVFDPMYFVILAPGLLLAMWAQYKVRSTFSRASEIPAKRGWSGRDVAQAILNSNGLQDVEIEPVTGYLSDHYDPRHKVLRLSPDVYQGRSLAAFGVAAHEVGHAIQDAHNYAPLGIRNAIVPMANFGSSLGMLVLMVGIGMGLQTLAILGCALFTAVVIFQVVNLPVEFNASRRAREALLASGIISPAEDKEVGKVLNAAAMTYVAATLTSILTLLYFLMRAGVIGGGRNRE
jgi:Zn-dependent membrane protease YugP